jgi:hypothetical protein
MSKYPDVVADVFPAGQVHLIGGAPGAGKTAFEAWMCSHVLRGVKFLGHQTNAVPWWGAIVLDRGAGDRRNWWRIAGIPHLTTGASLPLYSLTDDPSLRPSALYAIKDLLGFVEKQIDRLQPPPGGVLTIDVANPLSGNAKSSYLSSFAAGWALSRVAQDRQLTVFAIMHGGKQLADAERRYVRLTDRIICGSGFLGAIGTTCYISSPEESGMRGYQEMAWSPHHSPSERFKLKRTQDGLYAPWQSSAEKAERVKTAQDLGPEDLLTRVPLIGEGYITTAQLLDAMRSLYTVPQRTFERWLMKLVKDGRIVPYQNQRGKWVRPVAN